MGYNLVSGGTDTHMILLDLRAQSLDGARLEAILEAVNIACNKNSTPGDKSALTPSGIRIGTPAMTTRGFGREEFKRVAGYFDYLIRLAKKIQGELPKEANKQKDFRAYVLSGTVPELQKLKIEIAEWASTFPLPVGPAS
jgi:glycine hydroxymethyltransferase